LREIIASETDLASARITAYGIDALLIAAASILKLPAFVDVDATPIPHKSGAAYTLLVHRHWHCRRGWFSGYRDGRFRAAVTTWLVVAEHVIPACIQPFRTLVNVYNFERNILDKKIYNYLSFYKAVSFFFN